MAEPKRVPEEQPKSNLGLDGFDQFFTQGTTEATAHNQQIQAQVEKLLERFFYLRLDLLIVRR